MSFFLCAAGILYIPYFDRNAFGVNAYGSCMGALSVGTICGAALTSMLPVKIQKGKWMMATSLGYFALVCLFPMVNNLYGLMLLFAVMGGVDAVMHNVISACLQMNTDRNFRGTVFPFTAS